MEARMSLKPWMARGGLTLASGMYLNARQH